MTALPPTKGHGNLIRFAKGIAGSVTVIVCTQPDEPFVQERIRAITEFSREIGVHVDYLLAPMQQEPVDENDTAFWDEWKILLNNRRFRPGDYIVASEHYGAKLAEVMGGTFMPYDIQREIQYTKASLVRAQPFEYFATVLPEFQHHLRMRVTIFGAESTGKTTLSRDLVEHSGDALWLPEWARPYLEEVGNEITPAKMGHIAAGQWSLQAQANSLARDLPLIVQDTDLYSTLGYWEMYSPDTVRSVLSHEAKTLQSDLYLITPSNIPFEPDPLRYGGDVREAPDEYWVALCEREGLNYVVLNESDSALRVNEAEDAMAAVYWEKFASKLQYQREGREYRPA
jgi:HTH-type transcriptional repressor of NAD biosynthesis genes